MREFRFECESRKSAARRSDGTSADRRASQKTCSRGGKRDLTQANPRSLRFSRGTPRDGTSPVRPTLESEGNARARPNASVARRRGDPKAARDPRARNAAVPPITRFCPRVRLPPQSAERLRAKRAKHGLASALRHRTRTPHRSRDSSPCTERRGEGSAAEHAGVGGGSSSSTPAPPKEKRPREPDKVCAFCHDGEDSDDPDEDPLIPIESGQKQLWAHENCIWWCPDLYQDRDLKWQNVGKALRRCHTLKCAKCGEGDAPLGCKREACRKTWHYPCALDPDQGLVILEDEFCVACPKCHEILKREEREAAKRQAEAAKREEAGSAPAGRSGGVRAPTPAPTASAAGGERAGGRGLRGAAPVRAGGGGGERRGGALQATLEKMFTARKERDAAHRERDAARGERDAVAAQLAAADKGADRRGGRSRRGTGRSARRRAKRRPGSWRAHAAMQTPSAA